MDENTSSTVSVMIGAWAIVDSLNRLRGLLEKMPGMKGRGKNAKFRLFMDSTAKIPELRNTVQRLDTSIGDAVDDQNWTVLGTLS